ncbi:MAG: glutathione S-transferase family protein [Steroidobacteraceae bacterium]|nr:glutathione S-transferase family protein [Steroidobacteraceae bacterium]MDW8260397.1 glutathione S-transferase family protein [Gammaproteobacteria bacterium]
MAIDLWWCSGSPYSWRVQLALEHKRLTYNSHLLQLSRQEHKSPQMLAMNPRGRLPVLKDGEYVVFESLAILYYLDLKYPEHPIFGRTPEEAGVIMRVINEFQAYTEAELERITRTLFAGGAQREREALTDALHLVAREARTIELRVASFDWIVGESCSAVDFVIYPWIKLLLRALQRPDAQEFSARFLPIDANYPALGRWLQRIEALPGYERTYPPHWRASTS